MSISITEAKQFVLDADKGGENHGRENWLYWAKRSWDEIKRREPNDRLLSAQSSDFTRTKRKQRYPAWYSIYKIRQPLVLSRIGTPIGKDTTQDGNDNIGATAAICLERLATSLARSFDFFGVMCAARDDFLTTNFGLVRGYYERDEIKQAVREYITPQKVPGSEDVTFYDSKGKEVFTDQIMEDDEGYFIELDEVVDVENERICLEPVLYSDVLLDPDIRRFARCKRLAFVLYYSEQEFKEVFGVKAWNDIPKEPLPGADESIPKRQNIKVYEYWDLYERDVLWWAENGTGFIKPLIYPDEDEDTEAEENGLYSLNDFFPCPEPLTINSPTDDFWPIPEFAQVKSIIDDIHGIFGKMFQLTKAIRPRFLFDASVEGLKAGLNEAATGEGIGIDNLASNLAGGDGDLRRFVQYVPVADMIEGLNQLYTALEQRLNVLYKITGTGDLLQGITTENSGKTLGERQIEEKYSTNQLYEPQRKMAEFVRAGYELMCELALKNFKQESLDTYIMPQTLEPNDQRRYRAALGMLKQDKKRFRIELETDSTIALNERYDNQIRMEFVNALTAALEKTANVAQSEPSLIVPTLHCLKYLIQGFRQAKMFQEEITQAIDQVIEQASQPKPPPFNKDEVMAQLKGQELQAKQRDSQVNAQLSQMKTQIDAQLKGAKIQSDERIAIGKMQSDNANKTIEAQLKQFDIQSANEQWGAELELSYNQLRAAISEAQQKLVADRDALIVEMQKVGSDQQVKAYELQLMQQTAPYENALKAQEQALEARRLMMQSQQISMEDAHVQADNVLQAMRLKLDAATLQHEKTKGPDNVTINLPEPKVTSKKVKVSRDKFGNIKNFSASDTSKPVE